MSQHFKMYVNKTWHIGLEVLPNIVPLQKKYARICLSVLGKVVIKSMENGETLNIKVHLQAEVAKFCRSIPNVPWSTSNATERISTCTLPSQKYGNPRKNLIMTMQWESRIIVKCLKNHDTDERT